MLGAAKHEALDNTLSNSFEALSSALAQRHDHAHGTGGVGMAVTWVVILSHPLIADERRASLLRSAFMSLGACCAEDREAFASLAGRCGTQRKTVVNAHLM